MTEVWELTLDRDMEGVPAACWGCGKVEVGLRACKGSCGGAVVVCGRECQAKAWKEGGHKHWCTKEGGER